MARTRITFALDGRLAEQARRLGIDISAAARAGVRAAIRSTLTKLDRAAYERLPEEPDTFWNEAEVWGLALTKAHETALTHR